MTLVQPIRDAKQDAPFTVTPAVGEAGCMVFASPHSGRLRPDDMGAAAGLSIRTLRSAEDVDVDALIASGPAAGAPVIAGRVARAYLDLNRAPHELDAELIEMKASGEPTAKTAAGFGVVPRRAGDGTPLYDRRLSLAEATGRVERVHAPYHAALAVLIEQARRRHGMAFLIDWHSMPSRATGGKRGARGPDVVLGDRHGSACRGDTTRRMRAMFEAEGFRTALNAPYAGGYATQFWGRPDEGLQAIQIEINRALYLDEATLEPSADRPRFARALDRVIAAMGRETWAR